jgi:hypothetical protein
MKSPKLCYIAPPSPPKHLPNLTTALLALNHFHVSTSQAASNSSFPHNTATKSRNIMSPAAAGAENHDITRAGRRARSQRGAGQALTPPKHHAHRNDRERSPSGGLPIHETVAGASPCSLPLCAARCRRTYPVLRPQ